MTLTLMPPMLIHTILCRIIFDSYEVTLTALFIPRKLVVPTPWANPVARLPSLQVQWLNRAQVTLPLSSIFGFFASTPAAVGVAGKLVIPAFWALPIAFHTNHPVAKPDGQIIAVFLKHD